MDRREELKAKARDYERKDQPEHALEVYLSVVGDLGSSAQGAIWARIGDLQVRIGSAANAVESYSRAVTAFAESGQPNNALAVSQRILRLDPADADVHLRLGQIALAQGYREYARAGIGTYARLMASTDRPESAIEPLTTLLARFPDETGLWKDWEEELTASGKASEIGGFLERLRDALAAGGHTDAVEIVSRELLHSASTNVSGRAADAIESASGAAGDGDGAPREGVLPLLDNTVDGGQDTAALVIAPLEGLQATGSEAYPEDQGSPADHLPLLGTLPDLTTDRADASSIETSAPLAGLERFETGEEAPWGERVPGAETVGSGSWSPEGAHGDEDEEVEDQYGADLPLLIPDLPLLTDEAPASANRFHAAEIAAELRQHAGVDVEFADAASHYDLGLAYKEMDRFDESLANLAMAIEGGHDAATVLEVAAEILVGKGEFGLADDLLRRLPGVGDQATPEHLGVHYWLARASEEAGRREDARHALELVVSVDPGFRDASERLRKLV